MLRVISPRGGRSRSRGCRHCLELHGPLLRAAPCEAESGKPWRPVPEPSRTLEAGPRGNSRRRGTTSCLQIDDASMDRIAYDAYPHSSLPRH